MITIAAANALHIPLPDQSVQCVITSPPYWGLRDYGISDQIGLERMPTEYVAHIVAVMRECWRVLKDDGVMWLNLGDSYARQVGDDSTKETDSGMKTGRTGKSAMLFKSGNNKPPAGLKPKDLCGIPWRVAFALQDAGWYLRQDIIWHKPNPMPESVTDRCTKAHEYVFLLTKQARYYYDAEAIKDPVAEVSIERAKYGFESAKISRANSHPSSSSDYMIADQLVPQSGMRNKRSVWTIATSPYSGAHFATFPPALIEPMILAGSRRGDTVLDPFAGSGTTGVVAVKHGRRAVLLDLNTKYIDLQFERTNGVQMVM